MKKSNIGFLVVTGIVCILAYFPTFRHGFTNFDDQVQIAENPYIQNFGPSSIVEIFSSTFVGMYQPVTTLISGIFTSLLGLKGSTIHALSLVFHFLNGVLIFMLLQRFFNNKLIVYLLFSLFLLHPMQVESVAWASALSTLTFNFFLLLSFNFYCNFFSSNKKTDYTLSLIFFVVSCLAKSAAIILPLLLILFDWFKHRTLKTNYLNKIPFLAISVLFGVITITSRESSGHISDLSETFSLIERAFLIGHSILFYPSKFIIPIKLSAFYPYPELINGSLPLAYYFSLPIILLLLGLVYKFKKNSLVWFGTLWYFIAIGLVLQFIPVGNQITTDRYIYLPMVGLLLILGALLSKIKSKSIIYSLFLVPLIFGYLSHERTKVWENDQTLWSSVLEVYPNVAQAYNNLGSYSLKENQAQKAFEQFNKAIQLQGNYADAYSNRGNIYSNNGKSVEAINDFTTAINLEPHADAYFNRANEYAKLKKLDFALTDYTKSLSLKPTADTYTNRAYAYLNSNNIPSAKADLEAAIKLNPKFDRAYFLYGMIEFNVGSRDVACTYFKQAAALGNATAKKAAAENCF